MKKAIRKILYVLYQPYKYLVFAPYIFLSTTFFGSLGVFLASVFNARAASRIAAAWYARLLCYLTPVVVKVIGKEKIKKDRSCVVIANHQSHYDPLVINGWLGLDLRWVMKKELRRVPLFGYACEKAEFIIVDRSNHESAMESIRNAKRKIINGTSVVFFVEGTRSMTGKLLEFKKGAFKMAMDLKLPILPISMINTRNILPPKTLKLFPGRVKMVVHDMVDVMSYKRSSLEKLMRDVRTTIENGIETYSNGWKQASGK